MSSIAPEPVQFGLLKWRALIYLDKSLSKDMGPLSQKKCRFGLIPWWFLTILNYLVTGNKKEWKKELMRGKLWPATAPKTPLLALIPTPIFTFWQEWQRPCFYASPPWPTWGLFVILPNTMSGDIRGYPSLETPRLKVFG